MEEINLGVGPKSSFTSLLLDTQVYTDVFEEFTLPDYVNEVRKVLFVKAGVLPEQKFLQDGADGKTLSFGGTVTYAVLYTDDENRLCQTSLYSSYEDGAPVPEQTQTVLLDTLVDTTQVRVLAPRKISLKARLKSRILCFGQTEIEEDISPKASDEEFYLERLFDKVKTASLSTAEAQNIHVSDHFDWSEGERFRPIMADASLAILSSKAENGVVSVNATLQVCAVCETESGLKTVQKTLPLKEDIICQNATPDSLCAVIGREVSLTLSGEEGEQNRLYFDVTCELECQVYKTVENVLLKDAYSTKSTLTPTYEEVSLLTCQKAQNTFTELSGEVKRKNNDMKTLDGAILDKIVVSEINPTKKGLSVQGEQTVFLFGTDENGALIGETVALPISLTVELPKTESAVVECSLVCGKHSFSTENDKIVYDLEVCSSVVVLSNAKTTFLGRATLQSSPASTEQKGTITVYFPQENETLFEIGKKYRLPLFDIAKQNGLEVKNEVIKNPIML